MKRFLAMMIAAMMIMSLAACGGAQSSDTPKPLDTPVVEQSDLSTEETDEKNYVDLSTFEFDVAEEVYVDENGNFQQGLEKDSDGAVLVSGSGVKITAKTLTDSETNEAKIIALEVENKSGGDLIVQAPLGTINGYMTRTSLSVEVADNSEAEGTFKFTDKQLALLGIDTAVDMEIAFRIFSPETYENYIDTPMIRISTPLSDGYEYTYDDSGMVLHNENDVVIVSKGMDREDDILNTRLLFYIENKRDTSVTLQVKSVVVNGYEVAAAFSSEVFSGLHAVEAMPFIGSELPDNGIEKIKNAEIVFEIIDTASGEVIAETAPSTIDF